MGSWILWGYSWFISLSFDLNFPKGELTCLHQCALWILNPCKLLNSLPQSHVAGYISWLLPYEQVWWVIYSPSPLQTSWGHFSFIVVFIFVKFLSFQDVNPTFWGVTLSFQRVILLFRESWCSNFHHTMCKSMCNALPSSATNQDDSTVSVAQGSTVTPGTICICFHMHVNIYISVHVLFVCLFEHVYICSVLVHVWRSFKKLWASPW